MADLQTPPTLPQSYLDHRNQATDQAAYDSEMARIAASQPQQAPAGQLQQPDQPQNAPRETSQPEGQLTPQQQAEHESMVGAEVSRLASDPTHKQKYGAPEDLRQAAEQNVIPKPDDSTLAGAAQDTLASTGARFLEQHGDQVKKVAGDIAYGTTVELPRALYSGAHSAVKSVFKMADDLDDWSSKKFDDLGMSWMNAAVGHERGAGLFAGYHLLSGSEAEAAKAAGTAQEVSSANMVPFGVSDKFNTTTATVIKNTSQFITGMMFAGSQLRALSVPTNLAGWAGRGITAAQGFIANFEAFDGAQHRLSDLVQSVPALRNPVTEMLASKDDDGPFIGRIKNAVEGTVIGQAADGLLASLRLLRGASAAHSAAQEIVDQAAAAPPPSPSAGIDALGDAAEKAPTIKGSLESWGFPTQATDQQSKLASAAEQARGINPEDVAKLPEVTHEVGEVGDHTVTSPNGEISAQENGGYLQVKRADVAEEARGTGEGMAMMNRLAQEAESRKLTLASDVSVSPDAQKLYEGLGRRGYEITQNPTAKVNETTGNLVSGDGKPVFEVAKPEAPGVSINFRRIDTSDDIKDAMQNLADKFSENIDVARRGVQTFEMTKLGAQAQDAFQVLMDRRVGQPLNDVQSLAARQLWASSASKTMELANIATESPTLENLTAFRKMLATHAAIQEQVIAARTETARALSSWRIPASDDPLRIEQMVAQLSADQGGIKSGADAALALAQRVKALANANDWESMSNVIEKSVGARTRDAVLEGWTNGLLTAPITHVKVLASNIATAGLRIAERATAGQLDKALGSDGVAAGEASAQVSGLLGGLKDAFVFAGKLGNAFLNEEGRPALAQMINEGTDPMAKSMQAFGEGQYSLKESPFAETTQHVGAISSEALGMADTGWLGKSMDYLGQLVRTPGRSLTAEHDFFRSIGYRMELNALATRQATQDVTSGLITEDAMGSRIAELIDKPPPNLHMDAVNGALYQTFTDAPGKFAELIGEARNNYPLLKVILPFYKIPSRILSFTAERSPIAPLMGTFQANMAAGGARQSLALAQMGVGTSIMLATADGVLNGTITGSGPVEHGQRAALENEGWQPYSKKVGDKWFQYNKLETVGSSMAMAADAIEAIRNYHSQVNGDDPDVTNLAMATTFAIANDITSKSYLQGLSTFFEAMGSPSTGGNRMLQSLAGSTVPAGVAAIDRVTDPNKRAVYGMIDAIKARTPGVSESLPAARNLWGEPIASGSGEGKAFDLLSPFQTHEAHNEPIDKELISQGINLPRVQTNQTFEGVGVNLKDNPKMYERFQELVGNAYKGPDGMGLKDKLNAIVTGNDPYSAVYNAMGSAGNGPDGRKAEMIQDLARSYRDQAKGQLMDEYPALREQVKAKQQALMQMHQGMSP